MGARRAFFRAAVVGLASLFGVVMPEWGQWLAFAILALVFFVTFRKALYQKLRRGGPGVPEDAGDRGARPGRLEDGGHPGSHDGC